MELYVDDFDRAGAHLELYQQIAEIFKRPRSHWFAPRGNNGDKNANYVENSVRRLMQRAAPTVPSLVLYNIPNRDYGSYSKGGASDDENYIRWVRGFAKGIDRQLDPIIIFEPDGLTQASDHPDMLAARIELYSICLPMLQLAGCKLYVDIGHPRWLPAEKAATILNMLDPVIYDGFSINVSNFIPLGECVTYGEKISTLTGGKHFVIDTSRNGAETHNGDWCNPRDKLLGRNPTLDTGHPLIDAFLWIKVPGESDGYCDGGPKAGIFWPEYAMMLLGTGVKPNFVDDPNNSMTGPE